MFDFYNGHFLILTLISTDVLRKWQRSTLYHPASKESHNFLLLILRQKIVERDKAVFVSFADSRSKG